LRTLFAFIIAALTVSPVVLFFVSLSSSIPRRYNREEVVRSLGKEVNLNPPLTLGQLPDTPEELLKLDQVFIKSELKVGVIYVKEVSDTDCPPSLMRRKEREKAFPLK
jgi:RAP1 GTPase activating protein 1